MPGNFRLGRHADDCVGISLNHKQVRFIKDCVRLPSGMGQAANQVDGARCSWLVQRGSSKERHGYSCHVRGQVERIDDDYNSMIIHTTRC